MNGYSRILQNRTKLAIHWPNDEPTAGWAKKLHNKLMAIIL